MSRKKYALPQGISAEISDTVDLVKNNIGSLNYKIVPLSAIEFDPDNPRELAIDREDLAKGLDSEDPHYEKKQFELASLQQIAATIKKYGVRNAVEIYQYGSSYRLIHGERRCLGSILAGKKEIPAKVLDTKPNELDVRLLQLIENVQREDLTLAETLKNIEMVMHEYQKAHGIEEVNAVFLEKLINRSKPHCLNFLAVLNGPKKLRMAIDAGEIKNLEKAAIVAKVRSDKEREGLIQACINGASLKQLKQQVTLQKNLQIGSVQVKRSSQRPGKKAAKVNLGWTKNKHVVKKLIRLVTDDPLYHPFKDELLTASFDDFNDCASAFAKLIQVMDKVEME